MTRSKGISRGVLSPRAASARQAWERVVRDVVKFGEAVSMAGATHARNVRKRKFVTRRGVELQFTELGFGCAPLGNLYRPMTEKEARATSTPPGPSGAAITTRLRFTGWPVGDSPQRLPARQAEGRLSDLNQDRTAARGLSASRTVASGRLLRDAVASREFDYSYGGVMRSLEFSLEQLGLDSIDIVYAHDVNIFTHGSKQASDERIKELMTGGYRALDELRANGVIKAIGAGVDEWEVAESSGARRRLRHVPVGWALHAARAGIFDSFLPLCEQTKSASSSAVRSILASWRSARRRARIITMRRRQRRSSIG